MGLRWPRVWNHSSPFISLPVDRCKDIRWGGTGLREFHQGWHWPHWGNSGSSSVSSSPPPKAWSAIFPLSLLCHVWELMGVQIFVLLLTFFRYWWRNLTGGKKKKKPCMKWINLKSQDKWVIDDDSWLRMLPKQPFSYSASRWRKTAFGLTFALWVGKDIESHWWERWKMHLIT